MKTHYEAMKASWTRTNGIEGVLTHEFHKSTQKSIHCIERDGTTKYRNAVEGSENEGRRVDEQCAFG